VTRRVSSASCVIAFRPDAYSYLEFGEDVVGSLRCMEPRTPLCVVNSAYAIDPDGTLRIVALAPVRYMERLVCPLLPLSRPGMMPAVPQQTAQSNAYKFALLVSAHLQALHSGHLFLLDEHPALRPMYSR
jgi:hypothetical protein